MSINILKIAHLCDRINETTNTRGKRNDKNNVRLSWQYLPFSHGGVYTKKDGS